MTSDLTWSQTQPVYICTPLNSDFFPAEQGISTYLRYLTVIIYTSLPWNILNVSLHSIYMIFVCVDFNPNVKNYKKTDVLLEV